MNNVLYISAKWANKVHACGQHFEICGGACCQALAPVKPCAKLTATGCKFGFRDRPIVCLIYPFRVNKNSKLVLHNKATFKKGTCKGLYGMGVTPVILTIKEHLKAAFGAAQFRRVFDSICLGKDSFFLVENEVIRAYEIEEACYSLGVPFPECGRREYCKAGFSLEGYYGF